MKVTVHGGVEEIGGNKILLEDKDARIWLDMGQSFSFGEELFAEFLGPRMRFGLRDYFALDLMPKIPGLYSHEMLESTDFPYRRPEFSAILLSHVHFDHSTHIAFADPKIPVHLGKGTRTILDVWEETSAMVNMGDHDYRTFRTGDKLKIDGVDARPVHVDHSVPAAYGHILHCPSGTVVYTGDLRRHGPHASMTDDFVEAAKRAKPDLLICEGTRIDPNDKRENYSEKDVKTLSTNEVNKAKGKLAVVTFYPRDVDRMRTFYEVARATGRDFVASAKTARLLMALEGDSHIRVPRVKKDPGLLVYLREMDKPKRWERELAEAAGNRVVGADYVRKNQDSVILQLDFTHLTELIDIQPKRGGIFIHSKSEPFEEDDVEDMVKKNWLKHFGLSEHQFHASGHLNRKELEELVREIDADKVIPVHTEHPEMFKDFADKVIVPRKGVAIGL